MAQPQDVELKTSRKAVERLRFTPGLDYVAGSETSHPIMVKGQGVLPSHAKFSLRDDALWIEPLASAPVLINGQPVTERVPVRNGDWVALGSAMVQVFLREPDAGGDLSRDEPGVRFDGGGSTVEIIIGRLPGCGLPIDSPLISREHARLLCTPDQVRLEDLHSTNGTFVNGQRIQGQVALSPGDRVSFATFVFVFTGTALEPAEEGGRVRVEALALTKQVIDRTTKQPRNLLDGIDLVINPGELVVIFGTSGSGKSTLLDALNGRRPATSGRVMYNGVDLYSTFDVFRAGIGYVPQQDIVHRKIKVRDALRYTARLRLPPDTSDEEIAAHIDRVLERVGLQEKGDLPVDTPEPLSGGQLKRVSLAVELVANPNILFLDEATSGLDAGTDKKMMHLFSELAADGKTVVCVTHSLENIDVCDLVALLHRGVLVYYGPPSEAATYFGVQRLSEVYETLDEEDARACGERFRASPLYRQNVAARMSHGEGAQASSADVGRQAGGAGRRRWFDPGQAVTLTRRYVNLLFADRLNLLVLLLQAPLIALVVGAIFDTSGELAERARAESQITFVLVLSAIWFGCINSAREIVKELPVYLRERSVTLSIPAYLLSKLIPLAVLCAVQCASFLAIVTLMIEFPGPFWERFFTLFLAGFAATGMGLVVSAFVNTNDKAIAALPLLLIPQFILSNSVVALEGTAETLAKLTVIAYWGLDAMHATLDQQLLDLRQLNGEPLIRLSGEWQGDVAAMAIMAFAFFTITAIGLKLKDRKV
ncbi:MAG: ATP-binding cassette domain-containing protein [Pseudomonadota bacterium]|nr:ATP-binding cassette domain-containing protein [Pseudomonadota bacterium]